MYGRLETYLISFAGLRVDKNRKSWSPLTHHCSPYKPVLLLSILDHIASGQITTNFITPSFELTETFLGYIAILPYTVRQASMAYPFYHLESSLFWELVPQKGIKHRKGLAIRSMKKLRQLYMGAKIPEDLFMLMQMSQTREQFRSVLIEKYFAWEIQEKIREQSFLNCASAQYSQSLLNTAEPSSIFFPEMIKPKNKEKVRGQGFRKAIVRLYTHRCALCGIKMLTAEGHTAVDAAHIRPWSESHDDHPTNGMALCKLCHWSFDEGLMSVDRQYRVLISPSVKQDPNLAGHMLTLSERPIFKPQESKFWPDLDNFKWHRREQFR